MENLEHHENASWPYSWGLSVLKEKFCVLIPRKGKWKDGSFINSDRKWEVILKAVHNMNLEEIFFHIYCISKVAFHLGSEGCPRSILSTVIQHNVIWL